MNALNQKKHTPKVSSGFTILYAVLVATVLLSIGVSIYNISMKQYILASSSIDSQVAVYMADAGIECALYWDGQDAFATSTASGRGSVDCNGTSNDVDEDRSSGPVISTFNMTFNLGDVNLNQCAKIKVTKTTKTDPYDYIETKIESRGYNYCTDTTPRRVERALRVTYPVL